MSPKQEERVIRSGDELEAGTNPTFLVAEERLAESKDLIRRV